MSYPTSPCGDSAPTDPGAIDLERVKFRHGRPTGLLSFEIDDLIAAVEALRERVAELEEAIERNADETARMVMVHESYTKAADTRLAELKRLIDKVPS